MSSPESQLGSFEYEHKIIISMGIGYSAHTTVRCSDTNRSQCIVGLQKSAKKNMLCET